MLCIGREWRLCEGAADGTAADLELPTQSTSCSPGRDKADHSKGDVLTASPVRAAFPHTSAAGCIVKISSTISAELGTH